MKTIKGRGRGKVSNEGKSFFISISHFFICFRSSHLRTTSNKLLISLSVADFLILSMCQLVNVQNLSGLGPILGSLGCKIYGTISSMAAFAEIWTLTIVSIDRAQAIFHPIDTKKRMSSAQVLEIHLEIHFKIQYITFLVHFFL